MNGDNGKASVDATSFDSFGIEHIPKKIQKFIGNKNIMAKLLEYKHMIQCLNIFIGFIGFMLNSKSLLEYTNLFFSNKYEMNYKIIFSIDSKKVKMKRIF